MFENLPKGDKPIAQLKTCGKCSEEKDLIEGFNAQAKAKDGRQPYCKSCQSLINGQWFKRNRARATEKAMAWATAHPEKVKEATLKYRAENQEKVRETKKQAREKYKASGKELIATLAYRASHKAEIAARVASWQKRNPDRIRIYNARSRARRRSYAGLHYTSDDVIGLLREQDNLCCYCGGSILDRYTIEHVVPLSRGGGNGADNIALACPSCNSSKGNRLLGYEWCPCGEAQRSNVWV